MFKLLTLFNILLFSPAVFAINQDCLNLFKSKGLIPGNKSCLMNCVTVDIDMGTFMCPNQCDEYCKDPCDDFKSKIDKKIQNGISKQWPQKEKSSTWTAEQKSLVENALSQIPDALLANFDWNIFRLQKSVDFPNPASTDTEATPAIALYDTAFSGKYNLPRVISHELAHVYYRTLSRDDLRAYRMATNWFETREGSDIWSRRLDGFVEEDGKISPEEDFANNVEYYLFDPQKLKNVTPAAYNWIEQNIKNLKLKEGCHYGK